MHMRALEVVLFLLCLSGVMHGADDRGQDEIPIARLMPARVMLESSHVSVTRAGTDYRFVFADAPADEAFGAVGRIWGVPVGYAGSLQMRITGEFEGENPDAVLTDLADRTRLAIHREGSIFLITDLPESPQEVLSLSELVSPH
jgi:hypothetical protein